jgi:[1-hydroxy-2-(trimethylamino)ethyl]phosphonate dioxygenase
VRTIDVVALFATRGGERYGESVTQLEHALQCAALARRERADDEVTLAALLHDVGQLLDRVPEHTEHHHGHQGAEWLRPWVPRRIAWLVEHHVVAKRYLCTVDPRYAERLSPASVRSLAVQGAGLDVEQRLALETQPWFADAVRIRRWDDEAKVVGASPPPLVTYRALLEHWLGPQSWPSAPGLA